MSTPRRAVRAARLATEAQVEALAHLGRREPADERAVDRVLQHARAAASHVLLVARRLVTGAHEARARTNRVGAALADAGAAVQRPRSCRRGRARSARPTLGLRFAAGRRRSRSSGAGSTSTPGLSDAVRVEQGLHVREQLGSPRGCTSSAAAPSARDRRHARRSANRRAWRRAPPRRA